MGTSTGAPKFVLAVLIGSLALLLLGAHPVRAQRPAVSRESPVWLDPNRDAPFGSKYHIFHSSTVNKMVSCLVWVPPAYARNPDQRFPVIYWLHGAKGNQRSCSEQFLPTYINLLKQGAAPRAIVVAVNGIPGSLYADSTDGKCPVESVIIKDLVPSIDKDYRTIASREGRLIEGFSMGGLGAARLGFKYPDLFGAIVINSAGPLGNRDRIPRLYQEVYGDAEKSRAETPTALVTKNADAIKNHQTYIRVACGADDDLLDDSRRLDETLKKLEVRHTFVELPGVGHNTIKFYEALGPRAFRLHQRAFGNQAEAATP